MKYLTVTYHGGENVSEIIAKMRDKGWAVYNIWQSPTKEAHPSSNFIIITYIGDANSF